MNIGIIGAGKASVLIMEKLKQLDGYTVLAISDINEDAPGMKTARKLKIDATTDMTQLLNNPSLEVIFELTGNQHVLREISEQKGHGKTIVPSAVARILFDIISSQAEQGLALATKVSGDFDALQEELNGTLTPIDESSAMIDKMLKESRILSMNAKLEAARAGRAGAAFAVVVERIESMTSQINTALESISGASVQAHAIPDRINAVEKELLSSFQQLVGNE